MHHPETHGLCDDRRRRAERSSQAERHEAPEEELPAKEIEAVGDLKVEEVAPGPRRLLLQWVEIAERRLPRNHPDDRQHECNEQPRDARCPATGGTQPECAGLRAEPAKDKYERGKQQRRYIDDQVLVPRPHRRVTYRRPYRAILMVVRKQKRKYRGA